MEKSPAVPAASVDDAATSRSRAGWLALGGLLLTLAITYGLDRLVFFLRQQNSQYPTETVLVGLLWVYFLGNLLTAALPLALFWWLVIRQPHRLVWVGWLYLLVGLFISAYPVLSFSPVNRLLFWFEPFLTSIQSHLFQAAGLLSITGLALLLRQGQRIRDI